MSMSGTNGIETIIKWLYVCVTVRYRTARRRECRIVQFHGGSQVTAMNGAYIHTRSVNSGADSSVTLSRA